MADINVERKGPSIWPWIIGLLVLALLIWAIAEMVDTDQAEVAGVEQVEEPVAAVPTPAPVTPAPGTDLSELMPLGADDAGQMVNVEGQVVGQPTDQGFWVMTVVNGQPHAIFAQAPARTTDGQMLQTQDVRQGQSVQLAGTLQQAQTEQITGWIEQGQLEQQPSYEQWTVVRELILTGQQGTPQPGQQPMQPTQPGQQPQGQQQPMQPGDTVSGRY